MRWIFLVPGLLLAAPAAAQENEAEKLFRTMEKKVRAAKSLEVVFEPFYRLEGSRNRGTGGTGLGLAIARQLALAMDAVLSLHNRPDGGLEARLVLKGVSQIPIAH